ncbi:MAG: hypothetical protein ACM31L_13775 [Actinomycetota bacterium]
MIVIPGTCSACSCYSQGECRKSGSRFFGRAMWSVSCVPCDGYQRDASLQSGAERSPAGTAAR